MSDENMLGPNRPTSINPEYEKNKDEFSINGISVKDLLATKSTFSREEVNWMIAALNTENCKIHAMGIAKLTIGGANQGFIGASIVSERNLQGVFCHFVRCIDLLAFSPIQSIILEQQLHPNFSITYEGNARLTFPCKQRYCTMHFKDHDECKKFYKRTQGCMAHLDPQTNLSNAVSKIRVEDAGKVDPSLAESISEAEAERDRQKPKKPEFLADGLAELIAQARAESAQARAKRSGSAPQNRAPNSFSRGNMQRGQVPRRGTVGATRGVPIQPNPGALSPRRVNMPRGNAQRGGNMQRGNMQRGNIQRGNMQRGQVPRRGTVGRMPASRNASFSLPSTPVAIQRDSRSSTLPGGQQPEMVSRNVAPRESKVLEWKEKIRRPAPGSSISPDIIVKINLVKIGGSKTMKFSSSTLISDAIDRVAKQCGVNPQSFGLYRRSGLSLEEDSTFFEQDVINNDVLEFR